MIKLGSVIYNLLSNDSTVKEYVGTKIYPLVIPESQTLPCIVYERHGDGEISKDRMGIYNIVVELTILSEDYTECINITQAVYDKLEGYTGELYGIRVKDTRLYNISESFAENAFIQKLDFLFKTI